jgi:hypothetical protein
MRLPVPSTDSSSTASWRYRPGMPIFCATCIKQAWIRVVSCGWLCSQRRMKSMHRDMRQGGGGGKAPPDRWREKGGMTYPLLLALQALLQNLCVPKKSYNTAAWALIGRPGVSRLLLQCYCFLLLTHELVVELHASAQMRRHKLCSLVPRSHTWAGSSADAACLQGSVHSGDFE